MNYSSVLMYLGILIVILSSCSKEEEKSGGNIEITAPNGGESYKIGETMEIEWLDSLPENVSIELLNNENVERIVISSTPSSGLYFWTIPEVSTGTSYRIRIKSTEDAAIFDYSDGDFSINPDQTDYITLISPNGGELWSTSQNQTISWESNINDNVRIKLYYDDTLAGEIPGTFSDSPAIIDISSVQITGAGNKYKIRIESANDASLYDESDQFFTITSGTTT